MCASWRRWLKQQRGYSVVAFLANLGQESYLEPLGELALESGAEGTVIVDLPAMTVRHTMPGLVLGVQLPFAAPVLGQHTREILQELGYNENAIKELAP